MHPVMCLFNNNSEKGKLDPAVSTFVLLAFGGKAACFDLFLGYLQAYKNIGTSS
jgi:hypothetical protein